MSTTRARGRRGEEEPEFGSRAVVLEDRAVMDPNPARFPAARLVSIDALRGFNMFWIIGGAELFASASKLINRPFLNAISNNLTEHVDWVGFHFHDMIFPLFLFIMGLTFPLSLGRRAEAGETKGVMLRRILVRAAALFLLGLIYNGALDLKGLDNQRIMGVLQRLGLAWGIAAIIALYVRRRGQAAIAASLLVGYWLAMRFIPAPGFHPGDMSPEGNLANYLDRAMFRPGQLYEKYGDPEGLFSTLPAIVTAMLGILAGHWLCVDRAGINKVRGLALAGLFCWAAGHLWGLEFPIIKKIWTSSYVLVAAGWSLWLLAAFYWAIDVRGWRRGTLFFVVIGLNPITIYLGQRIIDFHHTSEFFLDGLGAHLPIIEATLLAAGALAVKWLFLYFLHLKRVYLKV